MIYLTCGHRLKIGEGETFEEAHKRVIYYWDSEKRDGTKSIAYGALCDLCAIKMKARKTYNKRTYLKNKEI